MNQGFVFHHEQHERNEVAPFFGSSHGLHNER